MNKMKKIIMCIAAALTLALTGAAAFAENAGFATESAVVSAKTPYNKDYVKVMWSTPEAETAGVPLVDGDFLFAPMLNKVNKLTQKDGKLVSFAEFDEKVSEDCSCLLYTSPSPRDP